MEHGGGVKGISCNGKDLVTVRATMVQSEKEEFPESVVRRH